MIVLTIIGIKMVVGQVFLDPNQIVLGVLRRLGRSNGIKFGECG